MPLQPSQTVHKYLSDRIQSDSPGTKLPSIREIAGMLACSEMTVKRVIRGFREKGELIAVKGKGTFILQLPLSAQSGGGPALSSVERIVHEINTMIGSGALKHGEALPQVKFLARRFRTRPSTITSAYALLRKQGRVTKIGKTHWLGNMESLSRPTVRKEMVLFNYESDDFGYIFKDHPCAQAYQRMEREMHAHGYLLRYENTRSLIPVFREYRRKGRIPQAIALLGMSPRRLPIIMPVLRQVFSAPSLGAPRLPVLYDWHSKALDRLPVRTVVYTRGMVMTGVAQALADFLVARRTRRVIAFFDDWHKSLHLYLRTRTEAKHLDRHMEFKRFVYPDAYPNKAKYMAKLRERLQGDAARTTGKYEPTPFSEIEEEMLVHSDPFSAALEMPLPQTWLFIYSAHAQAALDYLRTRGLRVPEDVSLLLLEDDPAHYHLGISFCDADWDRIGYLMAHGVIGDFPVERSRRGFIRAHARVVEKLTT